METSTWVPLSAPDFLCIGLATFHQFLVLLAVAHLAYCRHWPPYVVKNVGLVCATGLAGALHFVGVIITLGFARHSKSSLLTNCPFQGYILWTGAGLWYFCTFVRVYRNYKVLVLHTADMWHPALQILTMQFPVWMVGIAVVVHPSISEYDFEAGRCIGGGNLLLIVYNYAGAWLLLAVWFMYKMRNVRRQMNEYKTMMVALLILILWVLLLDFAYLRFQSARNLTTLRRLALINNLVRTGIVFWPCVGWPIWKYIRKDQAYLESLTHGFSTIPTPALLRASLADQLTVEELWAQFRHFADAKVAPELPDFYKACMERDKVEGYFERQAQTVDIVDTFVAPLAPRPVAISDGCRDRILASEFSRYNIFDEAMGEVLKIMQENCLEDFERSDVVGKLRTVAEIEAREVEAIKKAKLFPMQGKWRGLLSGEEMTASVTSRGTGDSTSGFETGSQDLSSILSFVQHSPVSFGWTGSSHGTPLPVKSEPHVPQETGSFYHAPEKQEQDLGCELRPTDEMPSAKMEMAMMQCSYSSSEKSKRSSSPSSRSSLSSSLSPPERSSSSGGSHCSSSRQSSISRSSSDDSSLAGVSLSSGLSGSVAEEKETGRLPLRAAGLDVGATLEASTLDRVMHLLHQRVQLDSELMVMQRTDDEATVLVEAKESEVSTSTSTSAQRSTLLSLSSLSSSFESSITSRTDSESTRFGQRKMDRRSELVVSCRDRSQVVDVNVEVSESEPTSESPIGIALIASNSDLEDLEAGRRTVGKGESGVMVASSGWSTSPTTPSQAKEPVQVISYGGDDAVGSGCCGPGFNTSCRRRTTTDVDPNDWAAVAAVAMHDDDDVFSFANDIIESDINTFVNLQPRLCLPRHLLCRMARGEGEELKRDQEQKQGQQEKNEKEEEVKSSILDKSALVDEGEGQWCEAGAAGGDRGREGDDDYDTGRVCEQEDGGVEQERGGEDHNRAESTDDDRLPKRPRVSRYFFP